MREHPVNLLAAKHPLIGHISIFKVDNRAVVLGGENIVPFLRSADLPEVGQVIFIIAGDAQQAAHSAAGAGADRDDFIQIAGKLVRKPAQETDTGF